jgi:hypothetical protein
LCPRRPLRRRPRRLLHLRPRRLLLLRLCQQQHQHRCLNDMGLSMDVILVSSMVLSLIVDGLVLFRL